ncbi:hypothetical protein RND81_13G193600 [Saponaria officinalis]|uniref:FRIGIDA-like protein n=1 Tax=Saponaria officinalis TaxID=3572 RepID=A0AAW1H1P2_SAPOF
MGDVEKVVEINLTSIMESTSPLLDKLGTAFAKLKAHEVAASNDLKWSDVEDYFRNLESAMKKKLEDIEAKEKDFTERESRNNMLLDEREAAIVAREQDLLDKVQELKDAAVAAISEAKASYVPEAGDEIGIKVSGSVDENTELNDPEGESPCTVEENAEGVAFEVNPRAELIHLCEQMDSKGILNFVTENLKNPPSICKETSVALGSAAKPSCLVLDALEGFFPSAEVTQEGENHDDAVHGTRHACLILIEALSAFLSKADTALDTFLSPNIKWQAKCIANDWKPKLDRETVDATNKVPLVAEAFLRLLATFRIASEFNEDELCKYVLAVSGHRHATELCHSLELARKIPGLVETLLANGRQIDAVHFIHSFQLSETVPSVPILQEYLKVIRRNSQGNGSAALQNDYNARELEALKTVIGCVEEYNLEPEYPLYQLYKRVSQLDKSFKGDKEKRPETSKLQRHQQKRPRSDGRFPAKRGRGSGRGFRGGRHGPPPSTGRTSYVGHPQRYPPVVSTPYTYPGAAQSPYGAQASDPGLYYYAQNDQSRNPYSAVPPTYGTYQQPPRQPYM